MKSEKLYNVLPQKLKTRYLCLGGECDVMVNKLSPDNQENGDGVVMVALVLVHVDGDVSGGGKRIPGHGGSGGGDTIGVVGSQPSVMSVHGRSPVGMLQVVANTLDTSVSLNFTLWSHQEGWTVWLDGGLGGVNQWQAVGDGIFGQSVLLCQISCGLMDDGSKMSNVQAGELSPHCGQTDSILGRQECSVDSFVGDTRILRVKRNWSTTKYIIGMIK